MAGPDRDSERCEPCESGKSKGLYRVSISPKPVYDEDGFTLTVEAMICAIGKVSAVNGQNVDLYDASLFPNAGSGMVSDGMSGVEIAWTGKSGNTLLSVTPNNPLPGAVQPEATIESKPTVQTDYNKDNDRYANICAMDGSGCGAPIVLSDVQIVPAKWTSGVATVPESITYNPNQGNAHMFVTVEERVSSSEEAPCTGRTGHDDADLMKGCNTGCETSNETYHGHLTVGDYMVNIGPGSYWKLDSASCIFHDANENPASMLNGKTAVLTAKCGESGYTVHIMMDDDYDFADELEFTIAADGYGNYGFSFCGYGEPPFLMAAPGDIPKEASYRVDFFVNVTAPPYTVTEAYDYSDAQP